MRPETQNLGAHTFSEILSQPRCWARSLDTLRESGEIDAALERLPARCDWLFIGCGSSFYVAQVAAATWIELTGQRARAIPASELLLFPELIGLNPPPQPVLISRSGRTSEVFKAAQFLEKTCDIRTLAITCVNGGALEKASTATIHLAAADERSMVMTRSFTSMLLSLQVLAATVGKQVEFVKSLERIPSSAQRVLDSVVERIRGFVEVSNFSDYVFLAQGPLFGAASEATLKVNEMSCSYSQCFHTLEFRHGPKSIVGPEVLLSFLLSEKGFAAEREVLEEMKALGGTTLAVTNQADASARRAADFLVQLDLDVPELARLTTYLLTFQLLGLFTGLKKGLDPDQPRNLSRVVVLDGGN